jgi:CheY-like chemotaxis protein/anti-sigma regulatory factor (Ser/Thr protein kinase)
VPESTAKRVLVVDDDRVFRLAASGLLAEAGYAVTQAGDSDEALAALAREPVDVLLLDVGLPGRSGIEVLSDVRTLAVPPRVVVVTADDTPDTVLRALRGQADRFLTKPCSPRAIVEVVGEVIAASPAATLPIEVISARPEWVELVAPCVLEVADRVQPFMMQLEADLPDAIRQSVGQAVRELLHNAIEWGGRLDHTRKVRIACLRTGRLLLYRIADPGEGFDIERITHAAVCNPDDNPIEHAMVREQQGLRPGGLGLMVARALVDELIYNEKRNEVVFVKYLDAAPD